MISYIMMYKIDESRVVSLLFLGEFFAGRSSFIRFVMCDVFPRTNSVFDSCS
jgi:hypothetical protein